MIELENMLSKNVLVVCGGNSSERDISLRSGEAVFNGLKKGGIKSVELFDLKSDNIGDIIKLHPDIVYLALHGQGGEDGCIQGMLELARIPYTGPQVAASAICMNKILTKQLLSASGIPTANFICKDRDECDNIQALSAELITKLGLPLVLKSPCQGSSIGVVLVKSEAELKAAVKEVLKYGNRILCEEYLSGTEITLPILGNEILTLLPEVEILSEREFYDKQAKYTSGLCRHITPARISKAEREQVRKLGLKAYRTLGCVGVSRIDLIVDKDKGPMIIEVNTCPGMTETSLLPDSAKAAGISFEELVLRILKFGYGIDR